MRTWNKTSEVKPKDDRLVETMVVRDGNVSNVSKLRYHNNLWWLFSNDMYVYYTPTHWRYLN